MSHTARRRRRVGGDAARTIRNPFSAALSAVLAAVLLVGASGCTFLFPQPPADLVDAAKAAAASLADLEGVDSAEASVSARDSKDHPNDWIVTIAVSASDPSGLTTVPVEITREIGRFDLWKAFSVDVSLTTPGDRRLPETRVQTLCLSFEQPNSAPGFQAECTTTNDLETIDAARRLAGVDSVTYVPAPEGVLSLTFSAGLSHPAAALTQRARSLPGFGSGALTLVRVVWPGGAADDRRSVEVSTSGPSAEVISALDDLAARAGVRSLSSTESLRGTRPSIDVESTDFEREARTLIGTLDPAADRGERPRTSFSVVAPDLYSNTDDPNRTRQAYGYVGLEGSLRTGSDADLQGPAPDSGWPNRFSPPTQPEATTAPPPPVPPADIPPAERTRLDQALAPYGEDLLGFLSEASDNAGVAPASPPTTEFTDCSAIEAGAGYRLSTHVMLPVWSLPAETNDSVNARFAAVTAAWSEAGLYASDRASGLDTWTRGGHHPGGSPVTLPDGVVGATIRGTAEGFSITAYSPCVK